MFNAPAVRRARLVSAALFPEGGNHARITTPSCSETTARIRRHPGVEFSSRQFFTGFAQSTTGSIQVGNSGRSHSVSDGA